VGVANREIGISLKRCEQLLVLEVLRRDIRHRDDAKASIGVKPHHGPIAPTAAEVLYVRGIVRRAEALTRSHGES
jgi:hypothetical protein